MKFRPLIWRNTHPYLLADRMEDLTPVEQVKEDPKCDRRVRGRGRSRTPSPTARAPQVSLYGFVRGTSLKRGMKVHVAGMGDFAIADASALPDPCPLPEKEKSKSLGQKQRLLYAPVRVRLSARPVA
jgi:ribosome biogenesis protein BMS1